MQCPKCKASLAPNSSNCSECGALIQQKQHKAGNKAICPNCQAGSPAGSTHCSYCDLPFTLLKNRYQFEKHLNTGGFAWVYLATDLSENRHVALKQMRPIDDNYKKRVELFQREAEILRSLRHLRLIPDLYDYFREEGNYYIVEEFIDGLNLDEKLTQDQKAMDPEEVIEWSIQIAEVLHYLHSGNPSLIHRDLTPDNLILSGSRLVMIDFGVARDIDPLAVGKGNVTPIGGKSGYAPPEQVAGKPPESRSDLFSLGATMFRLLTNVQPDKADSLFVCTEAPDANIPSWLEEVVRINLSEDVDDRYTSAAEIKEDLEKRQVTKEFTCRNPNCKHKNPPREPYCLECGAPLISSSTICPNPSCQNSMPITARHCIQCGQALKQ